MFMYAIGLKVGPQFFSGLARGGISFILIGLIVVTTNWLFAFGGAKLAGLAPGYAAGIISGSYTVTVVIGVATSAVSSGAWQPPSGVTADQVSANIAAGYAVSYILSTIGIILLIKYLPTMFGFDPVAEGKKAEAEFAGDGDDVAPGSDASFVMGFTPFDIRTYRLEHDGLVGKTVEQLFKTYPKAPVLRILREGKIIEASENPTLRKDDVVAVAAEAAKLIAAGEKAIGPEVDEPLARNVELEVAELVIGKSALAGKTIAELADHVGFGLHLKALFRQGHELPKLADTVIEVGDVVRIAGPDWCVKRAAQAFGSKPILFTTVTETMYLAIALVILLMYLSLAQTLSAFFGPYAQALELMASDFPDQTAAADIVHWSVVTAGGLAWTLASYLGPIVSLVRSPFGRRANGALALAYVAMVLWLAYLGLQATRLQAALAESAQQTAPSTFMIELVQPLRW